MKTKVGELVSVDHSDKLSCRQVSPNFKNSFSSLYKNIASLNGKNGNTLFLEIERRKEYLIGVGVVKGQPGGAD